jgi:XTP/dITP diphosphohydrolase
MHKPPSRRLPPLRQLIELMALLRSPGGCPWDREQDHTTLRYHAVEEVYELIDAIEAGDDREMLEELGDVLLQVIFHCQLARERKAFDLDQVAQVLVDKLVRRHPHVFGDTKVGNVDEVWANWDRIKRAEKAGTRHARPSALDGIPKHLPSLMRAEKLVKKARKSGLMGTATAGAKNTAPPAVARSTAARRELARQLFDLAESAQARGWSAEDLLRGEIARRERAWRRAERAAAK